jgi:hypothetical protein
LISLGLLTCVIGFIFDAWLEIQLVHMGMYIYSQVIPWGSVFTGTTFQFPLIWESFSVTFVMVPAAILCYRDDTGKSVAEKLAAKAKIFPTRPVLGTFLVMFAIMNVSYFAYGAWFWAIKASHAATSVACPWPYPEAKVYDPQGFYEKAGAKVPYSVGIWSTERAATRRSTAAGCRRLRNPEPEWLSCAASSSPARPAVWASPRRYAFIETAGGWSQRCEPPSRRCRCCERRPAQVRTTID